MIDWKKPARSIMDQVRGLQPWPGAYTFYNGKMLKITQAQISTEDIGKFISGAGDQCRTKTVFMLLVLTKAS